MEIPIFINSLGIGVSIFIIYATIKINLEYKLRRTLFFLISSILIFLWNSIHLIFNVIPENYDPDMVSIMWIILFHSALLFSLSFILGYHSLIHQSFEYRFLLYLFIFGFISGTLLQREDWIRVEYTLIDGFVTTVSNSQFWTLVALFVGLAAFVEIIYPLFIALRNARDGKTILIVMIFSIVLALFSNALLPLLQILSQPQALRFAVADIGFLIYFIIILRYPFLGFYDPSVIHRVMISDKSGIPLLNLINDPSNIAKIRSRTLDSGAFISINAILDEIVSGNIIDRPEEATQEFQSGLTHFYFIFRGDLVFTFEYSKPTGICYSKFKSMSRIFSIPSHKVIIDDIELFIENTRKFFPQFTAFTEFYQVGS